jgi:hypothetical protein
MAQFVESLSVIVPTDVAVYGLCETLLGVVQRASSGSQTAVNPRFLQISGNVTIGSRTSSGWRCGRGTSSLLRGFSFV